METQGKTAQAEIVVENVTMQFRRAKDEAASLKEMLIRMVRREHGYETFLALDNVSFTVNRGEVVGIIGTNGSGKSTLLKIISGALIPTAGRVLADRSKIQLLTLGTGFDPELTGRENVYLNGAMIGYSKKEIDSRYGEIVRFARSWMALWRKRCATIPRVWYHGLALRSRLRVTHPKF